jgi:hypothetical protein
LFTGCIHYNICGIAVLGLMLAFPSHAEVVFRGDTDISQEQLKVFEERVVQIFHQKVNPTDKLSTGLGRRLSQLFPQPGGQPAGNFFPQPGGQPGGNFFPQPGGQPGGNFFPQPGGQPGGNFFPQPGGRPGGNNFPTPGGQPGRKSFPQPGSGNPPPQDINANNTVDTDLSRAIDAGRQEVNGAQLQPFNIQFSVQNLSGIQANASYVSDKLLPALDSFFKRSIRVRSCHETHESISKTRGLGHCIV